MSFGAAPSYLSNSATLGALNASLVVDCTGYASAIISAAGNLNGQFRVRGSGDPASSVLGGRLLFKSGVGCLGTNIVTNDGTAISREYRVVAGGRQLVIDIPAYTSGSVSVVVTLTNNASIVFVNGPVHSATEEAVRAGRAFNASTGIQSVATGTFLNARFSNPAGSGKIAFIYRRRFDNNIQSGNTPLEYFGISNPVALTSPLSINNTNMRTGGATSGMVVTYNMANARLDSSPTTANPIGGTLSTGGVGTFLDQERVIEPGQTFGNYIAGSGGGLAATARLGVAFFWFEEDIV